MTLLCKVHELEIEKVEMEVPNYRTQRVLLFAIKFLASIFQRNSLLKEYEVCTRMNFGKTYCEGQCVVGITMSFGMTPII